MSLIADVVQRSQLGVPVSRRGLTVSPILDASHGNFQGDYVTLAAALAAGTARVTEISEAGRVAGLTIQTLGPTAVFIIDGEELIGAKQNRIANVSMLVPARSALRMPVSCVEQGRWSYRTREFSSSPYRLFAMARVKQMAAITRSLQHSNRHEGDQTGLWAMVGAHSRKLGAESPTGAMFDAYEKRRQALDEQIDSFAPLPNQTGAVFVIGRHVVGAEIFEHPVIFAALFKRVLTGYALDSLVRDDGHEHEPSAVEAFFAALGDVSPMRFDAVGLGEDLRFDVDRVTGAALAYDNRLIHLATFARDAEEWREHDDESYI